MINLVNVTDYVRSRNEAMIFVVDNRSPHPEALNSISSLSHAL